MSPTKPKAAPAADTPAGVAPNRLRVPQSAGTITVSVAGSEPVELEVVDGHVTFDPDDASLRIGNRTTLQTLATVIPGAEMVEA